MDAVTQAMFIKSLKGIQPSILAPTILQRRQILLCSTCDPVYSELCWCVLTSSNKNPDTLGCCSGCKPAVSEVKGVSGTQMQIPPPLWDVTCTCKEFCFFVSVKLQPGMCTYKMAEETEKHLRPWLLLCFLKHGQLHFLWFYGSKLIAVPLQWGPCSKAVPAEGSAAIAVLLEICTNICTNVLCFKPPTVLQWNFEQKCFMCLLIRKDFCTVKWCHIFLFNTESTVPGTYDINKTNR